MIIDNDYERYCMKAIFGLLLLTSIATETLAETIDCNGSGTVNMWLGSAAETVIDHNTNTTKRLDEIAALRKKKDGGRSLDKLANTYNCTAVINDPTRQDPLGLAVYVFGEKKYGNSMNERINGAAPNSFQLWLAGGAKKLIAGGQGCYEVKYKNEQGEFLNSGYLLIDPKLPVPEKVDVCN
jgi:hypothetical protein